MKNISFRARYLGGRPYTPKVYDHNNRWDYFYRDDGTYEQVWQYKTFPVRGLTLEF